MQPERERASPGRSRTLLGSARADGLPQEVFTSNEARWLGVQVLYRMLLEKEEQIRQLTQRLEALERERSQ